MATKKYEVGQIWKNKSWQGESAGYFVVLNYDKHKIGGTQVEAWECAYCMGEGMGMSVGHLFQRGELEKVAELVGSIWEAFPGKKV